ncbi:MAG: DUF748 domain-containing protein [Bacteroidales bacterium]
MTKVLRYIGLGIGILFLLALLLAPGITRRYVVKNSPELVGRQLEVDRLRVYYLAGKARITGLTLFEADQQQPFVSFDTLIVDMKPWKLLKHELYLQQFYLSGLSGAVIQQDSSFNFSDLIAFHKSKTLEEPEPADSTGKEPFTYHLYDIELREAGFFYENRNINDTLLLRDISFTIPFVGWDQAEKSEAGLKLNLEHDGTLEAGININPAAGDFDMTFLLQQFNLAGLTKLAASYADFGTLAGTFQTQLDLRGNINQPERTVVSGKLRISDLSVTDIRAEEVLGARSIRLNMREVDPFQLNFLVDSLVLEEPYVFMELKDSTNNFAEMLRSDRADTTLTQDNEPDQLTAGQQATLYYALQSFRIERGSIDFRDNTTGDPFDYHLSQLTVQTDSIDSQSEWVSVYAAMMLNERGELTAEAGFEPLAPSNFTLDYTITDFQLNDLNIYSRHYVGFPILYGEMFYRGHTEVRDKGLVSDNHLIMDNVELGEKRGGLVDLPLKLALYILKDRNDVIDLEVPVRGRTDDPKVSVGQIVWNTLKNLIVRTATAPYDYLSGLLGVDPGDIKSIEFSYLDTTLTDYHLKQMETLLELEEVKPSLEIELIYFNDPEREKQEILKAVTELDSAGLQTLDPSVLNTIKADSIYAGYEELRIHKVKSYLRTASDSTGIIVTRANPQDPMNVGSLPRFEARYSMKDEELGN